MDTAHFVRADATLSGQDVTLRFPVDGGTMVGTATLLSGTDACADLSRDRTCGTNRSGLDD
jgi:hypothetical protein